MWCGAAPAGRGAMRGGYTLLEILLVMAFVSIIVTVAVSAVRGPMRVQRMETVVQGLVGDVRLARTEAIRRNTTSFLEKTSSTQYQIGYNPVGGGTPVVVFSRSLNEGATFGEGSPDVITFTPFGTTTTMRTYVLQMSGLTRKVLVTAGGNAIAQ